MHGEAALLGRLADDLQGGTQAVSGPINQASGEALIGEDVPDRGGQVCAEQRPLGAVAILPRDAARTVTVTNMPRVSVTINRFRPFTFLPAS